MQLQFANGTVLEVLTINGGSRYFQGENRDSLEIQLSKDTISFEELEALTGAAGNTDKLILLDGEQRFLHEGYTLRAELSLKPVSGEPVTEERLCVVLAQKSEREKELESLRDTVDALVLTGLGV